MKRVSKRWKKGVKPLKAEVVWHIKNRKKMSMTVCDNQTNNSFNISYNSIDISKISTVCH